MPGKYDTGNRIIIVETDFKDEPELATVTLINGVVCDLLCQTNPNFVRFPELLDLAVVATGLGTLRSNVELVSKSGVFWDPTQWETMPRPFLNVHAMAYANAVAAWIRDESTPVWAADLTSEIKKPMKRSLKYLGKTNDCFLNASKDNPSTLKHSQADWWKLAERDSVSTQIVAVRQLEPTADLSDSQASLLAKRLRINNPSVVVHTISAVEQMSVTHEKITRELRESVMSHNEVIRSKALLTLTKLQQLDDQTVDSAIDMLDSSAKHNVYAAVSALGSRDTIAPDYMPAIDRAFQRALKSCDYEFIGLFGAAYNRWLGDAKPHVQQMLETDAPELLEIALDALDGTPESLVSLG